MAKQLSDLAGECRAHGNLGSAYFSKGNYKEALTSHRYQVRYHHMFVYFYYLHICLLLTTSSSWP